MVVDPSVLEALAAAVRANNAEAVAHVLAASPDITAHLNDPMPGEGFGATPLLAAVYRNNREMVEALLAAGADINARSHWWAGSFGVLDHPGPLVEFLISRGARIDAHAASRHGMVAELRTLLSADPSVVHARGGDGQTPLHVASSVEIARILLDHGADIDARDVDHESTAAQYLVRDRPAVARYLAERGCRSDILMAAALGDERRVVAHLDEDPGAIRTAVSERYFPKQNPRSGGTIYNWTLGSGKTAHVIAHEFGHRGVHQILLDRSPDSLKLAVACQTGDEAAVTRLLARDPSLARSLSDEDLRKLPDAARDDNIDGVRLMLASGWPVDARGQHGGTALHWAGWNGNTAITGEILRHGPSLETTDLEYSGTPLSWAIYGSVHGWRCQTGDYAGTVSRLLQSGATPPDLDQPLEASDAVREVLARGKG